MTSAQKRGVRTQNGPNKGTNSTAYADEEGEGIKKFQNYVDVIYGRPLFLLLQFTSQCRWEFSPDAWPGSCLRTRTRSPCRPPSTGSGWRRWRGTEGESCLASLASPGRDCLRGLIHLLCAFVQGDPSGWFLAFDDIKTKVLSQYRLLLLYVTFNLMSTKTCYQPDKSLCTQIWPWSNDIL